MKINISFRYKLEIIWPQILWKFIFLFIVVVSITVAQTTITLKNNFIEKYKNRATITATYTIDKAHERPNSAKKDGDLHIAGRAPEIKLPVVAEIMNAKDDKDAVDLVHQHEGTTDPVKLTGAWRIWCEHGGHSEQIQGKRLSKFTTSNPDHVFEIHPVTKIGDISLLRSLKTIDGFEPKDAERAFTSYEGKQCQIKVDAEKKTTTIITPMAGYNYVEFIMEPNATPFEVEDGTLLMAAVYDTNEDLLVRNRRMIFIKDSEPEKKLKDLKSGDRLHVLGIPRLNLAIVSWRVRNAVERPEVLTWNLPYEIIIVAVY
ncbi:MAG: hypothetical protein HZB59_06995 [Ignavibacteriales bacterium]|nr:hypothetical protein [Ignavibacteriales bacterium]